MHASSGALAITKLIATKYFRTAAMLLFNILQQTDVKKNCTFFPRFTAFSARPKPAALVAFRLRHVRVLGMLQPTAGN
jgi:hypothetical protein